MPTPTVLVLDDYPLFRLGIFTALFKSRFDVIGLANRHDVREAIREYRASMILIGADLRDLSDPRFFDKFPRRGNPPFILLTEAVVAFSALRRRINGVMGALHREATPEELLLCLDTVSKGYVYVSPRLAARTTRTADKQGEAQSPRQLTWRETQVIHLVQRGLSDPDIGTELGIAASTVGSHLKAIRKKLGVRNRTQVALATLQLEDGTNRRLRHKGIRNRQG